MEKDMGLLLSEQRRKDYEETEKEINLYRSGSAPPTVEGSLSAVGGLFNHGGGAGGLLFREFARNKTGNIISSEEELRSDPAYLSYYYSNVNLNPRLPPPILSKEDWRSEQILQVGSSTVGGNGDRTKMIRNDSGGGGGGGLSLFSRPPGFKSKKQENESASEKVKAVVEWGGDALIRLPGLGLGSKQKSLAEIFQDDLRCVTPAPKQPSRPISRNTFDNNSQIIDSSEAELFHLHRDSGTNMQSSSTVQHVGPPVPYSYAAALGTSLSRVENTEKENINSKYISGESGNLVSAFSGMNLSKTGTMTEENRLPSHIEANVHDLFNHPSGKKSESGQFHMLSNSPLQVDIHKTGTGPNNPHLRGTSTYTLSGGGGGGLLPHYQHPDGANSSFPNYGLSGSYVNSPVPSVMSAGHVGNYNLPPLFENAAAASVSFPGMDPRMFGGSQNLGRIETHLTGNNALRAPFVDPVYIQFLRALNDPSVERNCMGNSSYMDSLQKAYIGSLLPPHKSGGFNHHGYYGNHPAFAVPLVNPVNPNSVVGPGSPIRHGEFGMHYPVGPWQSGPGYNVVNGFAPSLLEEFKASKTRGFQLSEIAGHVVEFSGDQYGSRFIQQKLETAKTEEKNMVFEEIIPHALTLMTDVFGNYVVQKFFEHGMPSQRRELADKIFGHVMTLSLQMYGCRVVQKAIEVVDLDQKVKMVQELDGHIIRCVRDQNANHVVQKCIERIPEEHIQFILSSFCGQVVSLSTHPYGCRVMQRVLEQCMDPQTQRMVMEEILGSISLLAQDQYGNYVVQHVLEHGLPQERSFIIRELAGKIVQMSQQKFASNVVEKCLAFGDPTERQLLVNVILGSTDENEPLQAMMKDQFGNYVVQKVLETCSDQQRELILSRIKVHLDALKKYTFGKHIVARVEKLVDAGERGIAAQSPNPALEAVEKEG